MTGIQWTNETWNPTTGCDRVSPGCDNCYALTMAKRLKGMGQAKYQRDGDPRTSGPGFGVTTHHSELEKPLKWREPRRVFVNSMSDLFHKDVPDEFIARVWAVMAMAPRHIFQILTKRHGRMRSLLNSEGFYRLVGEHGRAIAVKRSNGDFPASGPMDLTSYSSASGFWEAKRPLRNVWGGVSVEDQRTAELRIPALVDTPLAVRFLSCEPLLSAVNLSPWLNTPPLVCGCGGEPGGATFGCSSSCMKREPSGLDWCIAGGESGPGARPCDPEWIRSIVRQCQTAGVPKFVKQMGSVWARANDADSKGGNPEFWPQDLRIRQFPTIGAVSS